MTQEEKAKAYDEALGWMRKVYPTLTGADKEDAEHYFPELAESEDERIRKELIELVRELSEEPGRGGLTVRKTEMYISYLEKQKEPFESGRGLYYYDGKKATYCGYPATEEKQKDYRKLYEGVTKSDWFKQNYVGKSLGEEQPTNSEIPKEQKPEWSEADEVYLEDALWCVDKAEKSCKDEEDKGACWSARRWLKSLRPSWKPSEEQMEALQRAVNKLAQSDVSDSVRLSIMYDNLKKLM